MTKRTYRFNEAGTIPGIPGIWSSGHVVTVDEDTFQVISVKDVIEIKLRHPTIAKEESSKKGLENK